MPTFAELALRDDSTIGEGIEDVLRPVEVEYQRVCALRSGMESAIASILSNTLGKGGNSSSADIAAVTSAADQYIPVRDAYLRRPEFAHLISSYSRSHFDVTPPQYRNRHNLQNPLPFWTSAMWDVFPGSDQEHCELLRKHRAHMHFARRVASLGGVFVTPPDFDKEFDPTRDPSRNLTYLRELMESLQEADPYWHVPPRFFRNTTIATAKKIFEHYEDDWPATVEDDAGMILGYVTKDVIAKEPDRNRIGDAIQQNLPWAKDPTMNAEQAYGVMKTPGAEKSFLIRKLPGREPEVITRSSAAYSAMLPPYIHQGGLGYVLYLGVSDRERTKAVLELMHSGQLRGVRNPDCVLRAPGVIIDTAHANVGSVEVLLKDIREMYSDLFLAAGAFNNPGAVPLLKDTLDMIKGPIGSGGVCNTYHTGVALPDAQALLELAVLADAFSMPVLGDGMGGGLYPDRRFLERQMIDTSEQNVKLAIPSVTGMQGGGTHIALYTSPNPLVNHDGLEGKFGDGEAGYRANQRKERSNGNGGYSLEQDAGVQYSEGVSRKFYPLRRPEHLAHHYWFRVHRLRSALSYYFSRKMQNLPPGETLQRFQRGVEIVHKG